MNRSAPALITTLLAFAPLLPTSMPVQAQDPGPGMNADASPSRSGVHFSAGLGSASMGASCDPCGTNPFVDRLNGVSGFIQLGGVVNPQLIVTGEFLGWISNDQPVFRRVAGLSVAILGYPSGDSGFFVKGALGGIRAIVEDDLLRVQTDAWMATTGIGYDIPVGSVRITPYLNYVRSFGGATEVNGLVSPAAVLPDALQFGAALTVN